MKRNTHYRIVDFVGGMAILSMLITTIFGVCSVVYGQATDLSPYSTAEVALDEISARITQNAQRMEASYSQVNTVQTDLGNMPTQYGPIITWINEQATANPDDTAVQTLKARKDKLVTEFNGLKSEADEWKTALDGVR